MKAQESKLPSKQSAIAKSTVLQPTQSKPLTASTRISRISGIGKGGPSVAAPAKEVKISPRPTSGRVL